MSLTMLKFIGGSSHKRNFTRGSQTAPDTAHFRHSRSSDSFTPGLLYYKPMKVKFCT